MTPSLGLCADDAAQLLEALDAEDAVVVGRSLGGMVAQSVAIRHPTRVRRLVLAGCPTLAAATERPRPPVIDADVITSLEAIDVDTLIVGGSADALCPPAALEQLAASILRASRVTIDGAGYMMNLEQPAAFTDIVRSMLA